MRTRAPPSSRRSWSTSRGSDARATTMTLSTKTPPALERWQQRRRRAGQLGARYPYAAQLLTLYQRLLEVQEPAHAAALAAPPAPAQLAGYVAERIAPTIV